MATAPDVLDELYATLQQRKGADASSSYVAKLYRDGLDAILKKVGEEATETVLAAKGSDRAALVHELADLWFHSLVLMAHKDVPLAELTAELARRRGQSGLDEKAGRPAEGRPRASRKGYMTMGTLSIWHWLIVLAIVVVIFGTKKLRTLGGDLGAAIKNFKGAMSEGEADAQKPAAPPSDKKPDA